MTNNLIYGLDRQNKVAARLSFDWETARNYFPVGIVIGGEYKVDRIVTIIDETIFLKSLTNNGYRLV